MYNNANICCNVKINCICIQIKSESLLKLYGKPILNVINLRVRQIWHILITFWKPLKQLLAEHAQHTRRACPINQNLMHTCTVTKKLFAKDLISGRTVIQFIIIFNDRCHMHAAFSVGSQMAENWHWGCLKILYTLTNQATYIYLNASCYLFKAALIWN